MRYAVILNPTAGHGAAGRKHAALRHAFEQARLDATWLLTERPGHATDLACEAAVTFDAVVAVGGDGTIHQVCQGLLAAERAVPLGVIPLGTGNDFVKMLPIPTKPLAAVQALAQAEPLAVDYGLLRWTDDAGTGTTQFINAVGVGFDAQVAAEVDGFKQLPGVTAYLAAVLRTLRRWHNPRVAVAVDGVKLHDGPLLLVTVGNGVSSGGGFYLTPDASATDGHLDFCLIEGIAVRRILQLLPRVLRARHVGAPEAHLGPVRRAVIESAAPLPIHADGEVLTHTAHHIEVEVKPAGLRVLAPRL